MAELECARLAVMASGRGSNFAALQAAILNEALPAKIVRVIVDQKEAAVIEKAKAAGIPVTLVDYHAFASRTQAESIILDRLASDHIDGILLAGYMRILSAHFVATYPNRIINIHPALLPSFPGRHGIEDAFHYGVKVTGVTIHYVTAGVDSGQIIAQVPVKIEDGMSLAALAVSIHEVEHVVYPQTLKHLLKEGVFN